MRVKKVKVDKISVRYRFTFADLDFWRRAATDKRFWDRIVNEPQERPLK